MDARIEFRVVKTERCEKGVGLKQHTVIHTNPPPYIDRAITLGKRTHIPRQREELLHRNCDRLNYSLRVAFGAPPDASTGATP